MMFGNGWLKMLLSLPSKMSTSRAFLAFLQDNDGFVLRALYPIAVLRLTSEQKCMTNGTRTLLAKSTVPRCAGTEQTC